MTPTLPRMNAVPDPERQRRQDPVQAAGTVNRWADHATHHRITSLVDTVPADVPIGLGELFERVDFSGIASSLSAAKLGDVVQHVFDRPFALVVRDKSALFAAVVRDPSIRA